MSKGEINLPNGPKLLIGELMMVALLFSSSGNEFAEREISLINEIAQAVKGDDAEEINGANFLQIFKKFAAGGDKREEVGLQVESDNLI